jgi:DNA-binding response OmpR family regulator
VIRRILLCENRPEVADRIRNRLEGDKLEVILLSDGRKAFPSAVANHPDAVLLELAAPGLDGIEACRRLRADRRTAHLPIMLLSGEVTERDRVQGFEAGANDFLSRPFGLDELAARVKALLARWGEPRSRGILRGGRIELDLDRHRVRVGGRRVDLTAGELTLLKELIGLAGLTLPRSHLLDRMRAGDRRGPQGLRTIDSHVARIRRRLGPEGRRIVTVRGIGYRFETSRRSGSARG